MAFRLTRAAEEQPIECFLYGCETFGEAQAEHYQADLQSCFALISDNPRIGKPLAGYSRPLRMLHHKRHYVIYAPDGADDILVVAVLHESMDMARHLGEDT